MSDAGRKSDTVADEAEQAWQLMVRLVMDSRGEWRRKVNDATGLPFSRVRALRRLAKAPMTMSDLAFAMSTDAPAATVAVNDLETRGLVERQAHATDRRIKLVSLTAAGRRIVDAANAVDDPPPAGMAMLSAADLVQLARLLRTLAADAKL